MALIVQNSVLSLIIACGFKNLIKCKPVPTMPA